MVGGHRPARVAGLLEPVAVLGQQARQRRLATCALVERDRAVGVCPAFLGTPQHQQREPDVGRTRGHVVPCLRLLGQSQRPARQLQRARVLAVAKVEVGGVDQHPALDVRRLRIAGDRQRLFQRPPVALLVALELGRRRFGELGLGLRPRAFCRDRLAPRVHRLRHRLVGVAEFEVDVGQARQRQCGGAGVGVLPRAFDLLLAQPDRHVVVAPRHGVARQDVGCPMGESPLADLGRQAIALERQLLRGAGLAGVLGDLRSDQERSGAGAIRTTRRRRGVEARCGRLRVVEAPEPDLGARAQRQNAATLRQRGAAEGVLLGREPDHRGRRLCHHLLVAFGAIGRRERIRGEHRRRGERQPQGQRRSPLPAKRATGSRARPGGGTANRQAFQQ